MIIGKIKFPIYGIIIVLSIIIGMLYIYLSLKKDKISNKNILLYYLMFGAFSLIFGKIFTILTNPNMDNLLTASLSSYGGVIGVILASIIFEYILPTDKKIIKYSIISLPLIYGVSKIACFVVGCCYGIPYDGLFSVIYSNGLNISLFPIQLVETIVFVILFIICNKIKNNKNIVYITIILCSLFKFLLDFLRYDHVYKLITINQIFSLILFIGTIGLLVYNKIKYRKRR